MTGDVPPLTKAYSDGRPYTRMPEVENDIARLRGLSFEEQVRLGKVQAGTSGDFIRSECLMHLLRNARSDGDGRRYDAFYRLVLRRVLLALPKCGRIVAGVAVVDGVSSDIGDLVRGRFVELLALDRAGGDRMDFFEVHFDEAVAKLRKKASARVRELARRTVAIGDGMVDGELAEHVEKAAGSFEEPDDTFLSDPIFRKRLLPEIDRLKPELRRVMTMLLANMRMHSSDPSIMTISRSLGCDERTVRNRRRDGIAALRKALGLGGDR